MTTEPKLPAKRPYIAPVLERIALSVDTQDGGIGVDDGGPSGNSSKDGS